MELNMFDAKDEKEYYVEVKFIKYGTYTFHATSKEHAMQKYHDGSWSDYDVEYDCYNEQLEYKTRAVRFCI